MIDALTQARLGWTFYVLGSSLACDAAFRTGGLIAAETALSSALLGAAAVLGVSAVRQGSREGGVR